MDLKLAADLLSAFRKSRGSRMLYILSVSGFAMWILFGFIMRQWPLVVSNSICLVLSAFILLMKLLPRADKEAVAKLVVPG